VMYIGAAFSNRSQLNLTLTAGPHGKLHRAHVHKPR
jgi:hypothetical protein